MGQMLFGGERSGTPIETRGAATDIGKLIQGMVRGGDLSGLLGGRLSSDAAFDLLSRAPELTDRLFKSLEPFEARETARQVGGLRSSFGTAGARFSRNLLGAEGELRSGLAAEFERNRANAILQAAGLLTNAAGIQAGTQGNALSAILGFARPGAPVIQEGLLPGLIGAGGNIAAMRFLLPQNQGQNQN